ncbi:uncharacterized protein LOC124619841 isoform X2 [Schistocerca americana]|uniref:uncharacterized protein LOC126416054 n=1 Tax=Schistocerca serialis cubense TaxID=2023355 RepID=UPI001F4FAC3F|nr:uncharacterized protein LOC124619841 isoform X2 [Schistocerca americana]XP_049939484.1 uncharacterized protein LOC126416054 [Schistocerca serialis cubense]
MVNDWSPEPPREAEEVSCNNSEIAPFGLTSSDSDDDSVHPDGYEPLTNMALEEAENEVTDTDSFGGDTEWFEQQNGDAEIELSRDLLPQASNGSISQLWAGPARDIALGTEGAAAVRAAMEGFSLPPTAVPAWASTVPEEQWTDMLRQRITTLQQHRQQRQTQEESPSV